MLSPLFLNTSLGVSLAVAGLVWGILNPTRISRFVCLVAIVAGIWLVATNPAVTIWDMAVAAGMATTTALGVFIVLVFCYVAGICHSRRLKHLVDLLGLLNDKGF